MDQCICYMKWVDGLIDYSHIARYGSADIG